MSEDLLTVVELEQRLKLLPGVQWVSSQDIAGQWCFNVAFARHEAAFAGLDRLRELSELPNCGSVTVGVQPKDPPDTRRDADGRPLPPGSFLVFLPVSPVALSALLDELAE